MKSSLTSFIHFKLAKLFFGISWMRLSGVCTHCPWINQ